MVRASSITMPGLVWLRFHTLLGSGGGIDVFNLARTACMPSGYTFCLH